jgi:type VI secretion system protein ImpJ
MFLRPHHFQAAARYFGEEVERGSHWNLHYSWGLRSIEIDRDALSNHRFVVRSLRARLRDGSMISLPEDGDLPALDIKSALARDPSITILLAVPSLRLGRPNASDGRSETTRFRVETLELEDENTGINPQIVPVRFLNLKLILSTQDQTGYDTLPLARIEKSQRAEALPELDSAYIPPVLACDAWSGLHSDILRSAVDRIGKKLDLLAEQVQSRNIDFDSSSQGERLLFEQLRVLNEAEAHFGIAAYAEGLHPLTAYLELCRLVGALSAFGESRRVPVLPKYDHDDLGTCFHTVKNYLDALLDAFVEPAYKERPFTGNGLRMQVSLESLWLEPGWQMYIGVDSPLETDDCVRLLTKQGGLDMKLGSSDRVDQLFRMGQAGLKFTHTPQRPNALPQRPGLIYFQVMRESAEWVQVQRSLSLAIRLNESRIAGKIQDQRKLTINQGGGATTTLQFTLFAMPNT